ncbi:hypothetical protein N9112_00315 [bacterium]|nr:hypothetical protein [bacterium]
MTDKKNLIPHETFRKAVEADDVSSLNLEDDVKIPVQDLLQLVSAAQQLKGLGERLQNAQYIISKLTQV